MSRDGFIKQANYRKKPKDKRKGNVEILVNGKLRRGLLPAIYFDTSVVIDYYRSEGMEVMDEAEMREMLNGDRFPSLAIISQLLKTDERLVQMSEVRRLACCGPEPARAFPLTSTLAMVEFFEWYSGSNFKELVSEAGGVLMIQKKSKKEIGALLAKLIEMKKTENREFEINGRPERFHTEGSNWRTQQSGLELLMSNLWPNASFLKAHGISGVSICNIEKFDFKKSRMWQDPSLYSFLQVGGADVMHILIAQHIGCKFFASFDSDFDRVKTDMMDWAGIKLLKKPEEIVMVMNGVSPI